MAIATGLAWLSAKAIDPEHVTRADLERFLEVARTENLRPQPDDYCRRFVNAWNQAVERVPGWPTVLLVWQSRRPRLNLSLSDFPSSLKADVDAWLSRQGGDDIFDELGPPKPLKPVTIRSHTGMILTCASGLVREGVPPETIRSLADLVRHDYYKLILRDLWGRTGQKPSATLARRAELLISIGRHYVSLDQMALDALRRAAQKVHPAQVGLTAKNRDRLRPFDDPETFRRLVNLPFRMQAEVERGGLSPVRAAQRAEMAVAIAILLVAPIRIKNLRMIEIGRQLHLYGDRMMLSFRESEVKNAVSLEFEIDPDTAELVRWSSRGIGPKSPLGTRPTCLRAKAVPAQSVGSAFP